MTVNLYQTGVSGLLTAQQQLATTGNNIANVNTEGYSRQRVEQGVTAQQRIGSNYIGTGTYVQDITRIFSQFSYKEQLITQTNKGHADGMNTSMTQLNDLMNFSGTAIADSLDRFYQSINSIADNPNDAGIRSITLTEANVLTSAFNTLNDNFNELEKSTNNEIEEMATRISQIATEIGQVNAQILNNQSIENNGQPSSLLDRRDQLLLELSQYTKVTTVEDQNQVQTVMIGQGTTLVAGITAFQVQVTAGDPDAYQTQLTLVNGKTNQPLVSDKLGGALAAKMAFRDQHLAQTRREIDRLAIAISDTLNQAQSEGLDLNQLQGADFFTDINSAEALSARVQGLSQNTGTLQATITITDVSKLPADEFKLTYDGTNYLMQNLTDNSITTLGTPGAGSYTTPYGFVFNEVSGSPSIADSFILRPTENAAANMKVQLTDGSAIAASSAVFIAPSDNNVSPGELKIVKMLDPVNARAAIPVRIDVLENPSGTFTYTYTDNTGTTSAPQSYTPPSQVINIPPAPATTLFTVELSGTPSGVAPNAPEQFFLTDAYGSGNSVNAFNMAATQEKAVLNNNRETIPQSLSIATAKVGSTAKSASLVAETADSLYTQAYNRNQQVSGVNLDEEAANMLKFQQAYTAASRIISTANALFDALLSATR
jgi:flagellar hook-associated protein 1 FlgK